jgi:hypothetical protein
VELPPEKPVKADPLDWANEVVGTPKLVATMAPLKSVPPALAVSSSEEAEALISRSTSKAWFT